jgi:hypothetical protein
VGASLIENFYNQEKLRDFLLGDLSEAERVAIEERFLGEEDFAAQLHLIEDELIEEYLRRELSARDHQRFEAAFLTQPRRRERVLVMKSVLAAANAEALSKPKTQPSPRVSLVAWLRFENAFARYTVAAAVVILLSLGSMILYRKLVLKSDDHLAQQNPNPNQPSAAALVSPLPSPGNSQPVHAPSPVPTLPRTSPSPTVETPPNGPTLATIMLHPTLVRDPAASNKLIVGSSVKLVRLQLDLERNEFKPFGVNIETVDGRVVWRGASMRLLKTSTGISLVVTLPAAILPADDYIVDVTGINDADKPEVMASYFFSVSRK